MQRPILFYSNSKVDGIQASIQRAREMIEDGAEILDIGGASSRPGAKQISEQEEIDRVIPVIEAISAHFPEAILSIDTFRSNVARTAIHHGAGIINDISAGRLDRGMYETVADLAVPYVLMHMKGNPQNMQENPTYEDITLEVLDFFISEMEKLRALKITDIILDPGFGFGKSIEHNYELLNGTHSFRFLECVVMAGISRKSMIYKPLGITPEEALNGTTALHMKALMEGAKILRVHDVKPALETIKLWQLLETNKLPSQKLNS